MTRFLQAKAIRRLYECDHGILTVEEATKLAAPFNLEALPVERIQDRRNDFKGAYFPDLKEGEWFEGVAAHTLAYAIADHLGVAYPDLYGMGSQLRAACAAVLEYLNQKA